MPKRIKAAVVCCSNGRMKSEQKKIDELKLILNKIGIIPVFSEVIYDNNFNSTGKERADILMRYYKDDSIGMIFDISGGEIANEILPFLDYEIIRNSCKKFFGYSDLTTVINAIYSKTGKESVLYQIKNLVGNKGGIQTCYFKKFLFHESEELFGFQYDFLQKDSMQGILVGGNIRCLLKLAGTEYWPDMYGKILLLEALNGKTAQMITYFSQLKQIGVFKQVAGILLGTFSAMEAEEGDEAICKLIKSFTGENVPIVKSAEIGHGEDSKAVVIGKYIELYK